MKKTLITLLLTIMMSAGIWFSADTVLANTIPLSFTVAKNSTSGSFTVDYDNLDLAIVEYTYYSNNILMSALIDADLTNEGSEVGTNNYIYSFSLPEYALSFKIWRVVTSNDIIKSLTGSFEYINSPETSVSAVETRIKTLYINDDLITKEISPISYGGTLSFAYVFNMHFKVVDSNGIPVPIDRIHSLNVEYDVIKRFLFFPSTTHVVKEIQATEDRNMTIWPFITPSSVTTHIQESIDSNYDWMVELASIADIDGPLPISDATLDQTTILTISYYYNGVFYEDAEVVDDPYDYQDIIDVVPGTTTPLPDWWELLSNVGEMAKWLQVAVYVAIALVVILVVSFIFRIITLIRFVFKLIVLVFKTIYKVIKFIVIQIPKGIMDFIIFLVVPSKKRKERSNVSRYF